MVDSAANVDQVVQGTTVMQLQDTAGVEKDAADATAVSASAKANPGKKPKKRKAKKQFEPLPAVEALLGGSAVPWTVAFTQRLGRHVVATRDIPAGDLVLREQAVAALPREDFMTGLCHACFKELPGGARGVAGDPSPHYCSGQCKAGRAAADARMAPLLPRLPGIARETKCDLGLLHMVLALDAARSLEVDRKNGAGSAAAADAAAPQSGAPGSSNGSGGGQDAAAGTAKRTPPLLRCGTADVEALLTHWERAPAAWRDSVATGCRRLHEMIREAGAYAAGSEEQLRRFAAAVNGNAHGVGASAGSNTDQGFGMFPGLSMLNHSCAPSCCYVSRGATMEVRAVEHIRKGQELTVQYINLLEPRAVRARQLAETKFFTCACTRCAAPLATSTDRFLEGVRCEKAGCKGVLLAPQQVADAGSSASAAATPAVDQWTCCECGTQKAARTADGRGCQDAVDAAGRAWQLGMALMQVRRWPDAKAQFEGALSLCGRPGQPHPLHVHAIDCRTPLLNCCRGVDDPRGAITHLVEMISAMRTILGPAPRPELCTFLELQHRLLLERAAATPALRKRFRQQAAQVCNDVIASRTVCFGAEEA